MANFMTMVLVLLLVVLGLAGFIAFQHDGNILVELPFVGRSLDALLIELLGGAFGAGVLFGWVVVWTRNLRRARKAAAQPVDEADTLDDLLPGTAGTGSSFGSDD